jgi:alkanesulfonate monooxygenase SsuD/methylene tetrahydromethanopterin reductase-like flavin-dependent oxidoreductase (luciferase family)
MHAPVRPAHLAVALDGAGWHPAAWREPAARPSELFTARYWTDLVAEAERGLLDFVTFEDAFGLQRTGQVQGRLDAVLIAARVAPLTHHVGLVPSVTVTDTEPFHISKAIATLDYVSNGRAGVRVQVAPSYEAPLFGRRSVSISTDDLLDEAADYIEVVRRLWDSWEDDAEIRDAATGRFIDREKLHYIDFEGRWFSVRGPSITPRPPQGQPVVAALAHESAPYRLVARAADVGFVTPRDAHHARDIVGEIEPEGALVQVFGDLVVFLDTDAATAAARKARLDERAGQEFTSDTLIFTGSVPQLADLVGEWLAAGLSGLRLRPGAIPHDLIQVTRGLVPELQRRGSFRRGYEATTLRGLLGLPRPANRFAIA